MYAVPSERKGIIRRMQASAELLFCCSIRATRDGEANQRVAMPTHP